MKPLTSFMNDDDASHETMKWCVLHDNDVKCNENLSTASCSVICEQNPLLRPTVIHSDEHMMNVFES